MLVDKFMNYFNKYSNWFSVLFYTHFLRSAPAVIRLRNGVKIFTNGELSAEWIIQEIMFKGDYEQHGLKIEENDLVVDIGANIGVFSVHAATKTRNSVFSFEPFETNFNTIKKNAEINALGNIKPNLMAVSDKAGSSKLFLSNMNGGHLLFNRDNVKGLKKYIDVKTTTLQNIMDENDIKIIDFLKVDCEGSEGAIFSTAPKEYLQRIRKIALEFHDNVSSLKHEELSALLEKSGFKTFTSWDGKSLFGYIYAIKK